MVTVKKVGLLCVVACTLLATADAYPDFKPLESGSLEPGERRVFRLRQGGSDLIARVSMAGMTREQDGPELRYGSEWIALENATETTQSFSIAIRDMFGDVSPEHAVNTYHNPPNDIFEGAQLLGRGAQLWYAGERQAAIDVYASASNRNDETGPAARLLTAQGLFMLSRFREAVEILKQLISEESDAYHRLHLQWLLADCYSELREHEQAIELYDATYRELVHLDTTLEHVLTREEVRGDLGAERVFLAFQRGDRQQIPIGRDEILAALSAAQPYNDLRLVADLTLDLATSYAMAGDWQTGLSTLQIARDIYVAAGSPSTLITVEANIGYYMLRMGELGHALRQYRVALELKTNGLFESGLASIYKNLGAIYLRLGDYRRSEHYYSRSLSIQRRLNLGEERLTGEIEYGNILRLLGQAEAALAAHERIINEIDKTAWNDGWLRLSVALVNDYLDTGDIARAGAVVSELVAHRDLRIRHGKRLANIPLIEYEVAEAIARYYIASDTPGKAVNELETTLGMFDPSYERPKRLDLLFMLSQTYDQLADSTEAIRVSRTAIAQLGSVRNQLDIAKTAPLWNARISNITNQHVHLLIRQYQAHQDRALLDEAFHILQQSRATSLRASRILATQREDKATNRIEQQAAFDRMLEARRQLLATDQSSARYPAYKDSAVVSLEAYERVSRPRDQPHPVIDSLSSLSELQTQLSATEQAVIVVPGIKLGFAILVTSDAAEVIEIPPRQVLRKEIASARKQIINRTNRINAASFADLLGQTSRSLLLIEDGGEFADLPWAAVTMPDNAIAARSVATITTPSLSEYFASVKSMTDSQRLSVAVLADPNFPGPSDDNGFRAGLTRLPYSAIEAKRIINLFQEPKRLYTGSAATIEHLLQAPSRQARILHLASHGIASEDNSTDIGFLLADSSGGSLLTLEHIMDRRFQNQLIVISGCSTAQGPILPNEGMMGLSRAFLAQGSGATLATLWPVSDRATAIFMSKFYELHIKNKQPLFDAVRNSQLHLRSLPRYRAPYFWAPYSVSVATRHSLQYTGP